MNVLDNGVQASAVKLLEFQLLKYFAERVKTRKKYIKVKFK